MIVCFIGFVDDLMIRPARLYPPCTEHTITPPRAHTPQAARLLDRMADSKTFKGNLLARQEAGLAPANERETGMDVSFVFYFVFRSPLCVCVCVCVCVRPTKKKTTQSPPRVDHTYAPQTPSNQRNI